MTMRELKLTLIDNDGNLKPAERIVYQSEPIWSEHSDDKTIQQLLMTGTVAEQLEEHNKLRVKTIDKEILRQTGRDVMLEVVDIFDLKWQVTQIG